MSSKVRILILGESKTIASGSLRFGKAHNKFADEERKKGDL